MGRWGKKLYENGFGYGSKLVGTREGGFVGEKGGGGR